MPATARAQLIQSQTPGAQSNLPYGWQRASLAAFQRALKQRSQDLNRGPPTRNASVPGSIPTAVLNTHPVFQQAKDQCKYHLRPGKAPFYSAKHVYVSLLCVITTFVPAHYLQQATQDAVMSVLIHQYFSLSSDISEGGSYLLSRLSKRDNTTPVRRRQAVHNCSLNVFMCLPGVKE